MAPSLSLLPLASKVHARSVQEEVKLAVGGMLAGGGGVPRSLSAALAWIRP